MTLPTTRLSYATPYTPVRDTGGERQPGGVRAARPPAPRRRPGSAFPGQGVGHCAPF